VTDTPVKKSKVNADPDYSQLPPVTGAAARSDIAGSETKIRRGLITAGQGLIKAKDLLPEAQFKPWAKTKFNMTASTAESLMAASRLAPAYDLMPLPSPPSALALPDQPTTPDTAAHATKIDKKVKADKVQILTSKKQGSNNVPMQSEDEEAPIIRCTRKIRRYIQTLLPLSDESEFSARIRVDDGELVIHRLKPVKPPKDND